MSWAAVIAGGAALIGGGLSYMGSKNAASTQAAGAQQAGQISQQEFNTITNQEQPFMQGGYGALNQLDYLMGIGPQGGYNAMPGMYNSAGPAGTYQGVNPYGGPTSPYGSGANPSGGGSTVYGMHGDTPNFGLQQGGGGSPTATAGQGQPSAPGIQTPRMMTEAHQHFSLNDILNPVNAIAGNSSNPLDPRWALPYLNPITGGGLGGAVGDLTGVNKQNSGSSPSAPGQQSVTPLQYGYGGAPGSYTPSQSSAGGYGSLLSPFTIDTFHQMSPAYQFQLQQGMQGSLNGDASQSGALSGAARKDLMGYNQGMANTAFNNAFNQYQTQQGNVYNRLMGMTQLGQNAAANTGQQGTALAGNMGSAYANAAAANAAGIVGSTNAITGSINTALPWLISAAKTGG